MKPILSYSVFNKDRKLVVNTEVPIKSPRMIHDFIITEDYAVFPDLPLEFNIGKKD